ncbi:MAG: hypothetical protein LBJ76_04775 [Candidatus Accumulibacter sp.]|jgi:hypothetical protein|nr:hypothetical protein [Accumulibacter sp.]
MNENDLQTSDLRRRMRELLAIPERDRTDEEWDELNELEIRTAPGNREKPQSEWKNTQGTRSFPGAKFAVEARQAPENKPRKEGRPLKRQHRRPKRPIEPSGNA